MRYSFQDRTVSKFGPPIWNYDKSLVARRAKSAISDCLVHYRIPGWRPRILWGINSDTMGIIVHSARVCYNCSKLRNNTIKGPFDVLIYYIKYLSTEALMPTHNWKQVISIIIIILLSKEQQSDFHKIIRLYQLKTHGNGQSIPKALLHFNFRRILIVSLRVMSELITPVLLS